MGEGESVTDQLIIEWARRMWPELKDGHMRIETYGAGVALMVDLGDHTTRIVCGIDHPDGRNWLAMLANLDAVSVSRAAPVRAPYTRPSLIPAGPLAPQPFAPSPSFAPAPTPDFEEPLQWEDDDERRRRTERDLVAGAMDVIAETFFRSDAPAPAPEPDPAPSFEPGGGDSGGAGASGSWDDGGSSSSFDSSSSYDSGGSSDYGGSSDSGGGCGSDD